MCRKHVARIGAEARLCCACGAGITFVIGTLIYAWTSYKYIHWIAPCISITIIITSIFTIFLAVFIREMRHASDPPSRLANLILSILDIRFERPCRAESCSQSRCHGVSSLHEPSVYCSYSSTPSHVIHSYVSPISRQLYDKVGFNWASTLIGLAAAVLAPIPFVLYFHGPKIRARSRFAKGLAATEQTPKS